MKHIGLIRFIAVLLVIAVGCYIGLLNKSKINLSDSSIHLLTSITEGGRYEEISSNEIRCDLATLSNIILRMEQDGYQLSIIYEDEEYGDYLLRKDDEAYRLRYTKEGTLTCLSSPYEKSGFPISYILEENNIEFN